MAQRWRRDGNPGSAVAVSLRGSLDNGYAISYHGQNMIRARLAELSMETLIELASEHDVDVSPDMSHEVLVDLIAEEIEEDILESELNDNYPIQLERKKYDLLGGVGRSRSPDEDSEPELPARYNETRIVVMLRDPAWAYAYWDLPEYAEDPEQDEGPLEDLVLRVVELRDHESTTSAAYDIGFFDIPILPSDNSRYINLPHQETHYRIDLISMLDEVETLLASSNTIAVPLGNFAPLGDDEAARRTEQITAMSGLQKLDVPTFGNAIPQRIISVFDGN